MVNAVIPAFQSLVKVTSVQQFWGLFLLNTVCKSDN